VLGVGVAGGTCGGGGEGGSGGAVGCVNSVIVLRRFHKAVQSDADSHFVT
jgi:hypothetical protein